MNVKDNIMLWLQLIWWIFWHGISYGALEGALFGTIVFPFFGTIFGIPIGMLIGGVVGAINGVILARKIKLAYIDKNAYKIDANYILRLYVRLNSVFTFLVFCAVALIGAAKPIGSQVPVILLCCGSILALTEGWRARYSSREFIKFVDAQLANLSPRQPSLNVLS